MPLPSFRLPGSLGHAAARRRNRRGDLADIIPASPRKRYADPTSTKRNGAFPHIDRGEFTLSLEEREMRPGLISQRGSSLCGPAALMFITGSNYAGKYYQFVSDLYEFGKATLGRLKIEPGTDCKNYNPKQLIAPADWVALAGIRDSENLIFDLDDVSDEAGAITIPHTLSGWLEKAGFKDIQNETNLYLTKGVDNLIQASRLFKSGYEVCFLVNADGLQDPPHKRGFLGQTITIPNHWVVMTSDILASNGMEWSSISAPNFKPKSKEPVQFTVFTWGDDEYQVPQHSWHAPITLEQWLQNYYGYVACKG